MQIPVSITVHQDMDTPGPTIVWNPRNTPPAELIALLEGAAARIRQEVAKTQAVTFDTAPTVIEEHGEEGATDEPNRPADTDSAPGPDGAIPDAVSAPVEHIGESEPSSTSPDSGNTEPGG